MSEQLLKELLEETKKQNKLQEETKREIELQNDLMIYEMTRDKSFYNQGMIEMDIDGVIRGRLYARLSDEDRSILERYQKPTDRLSDEKRLYSITTEGFPKDYDEEKIQDFIADMHHNILIDVYTERELYEYFKRVFERTDFSLKPLDYFWEEEWQSVKMLIDDDDYGEEEWEIKQRDMEMYENRITKNMVK